eukprot:12315296-Ditylum_brightwellii.AAC.1
MGNLNQQFISTPKLEGHTLELKDHIYNAGYALLASHFINTTREFAEYTGRTCCNTGDIHLAILNQEDVVFKLPTLDLYPALKGADMADIAAIIVQKEYDIYVKHKAAYTDNKTRMYTILYGQCSATMRAKLEGKEDFVEAAAESAVYTYNN